MIGTLAVVAVAGTEAAAASAELGVRGAQDIEARVVGGDRALVTGRFEDAEAAREAVAGLRRQGWAVHLVGLGRGELVWSDTSHELFASIIPLPLSLTNHERAVASHNAYLGTPLPRLRGSDRDAAVGTLAAFHLVISAENLVAHTVAGELRDLKVETWALLGIPNAARQSAEIVNACAAFEHAYQIIIVLNAQILRLCRALGLPSGKLRRWSDDMAGNDDDWCESLSLSFSASVSD